MGAFVVVMVLFVVVVVVVAFVVVVVRGSFIILSLRSGLSSTGVARAAANTTSTSSILSIESLNSSTSLAKSFGNIETKFPIQTEQPCNNVHIVQ